MTWVDICDIITSSWTYRQPGNFGFRSAYRVISILWSDDSIKNMPHALGYLDLLQSVANLLLCWSASSWCYTGLMICLIHIDESATRVDCCTTVTSYVHLSMKSWIICLIVWITGARYTILEVTHLSGCAGVESTPITIVTRCFMKYKYHIRLALITISHPIFLVFLGFFSLALC
jgi:hypothetical protein